MRTLMFKIHYVATIYDRYSRKKAGLEWTSARNIAWYERKWTAFYGNRAFKWTNRQSPSMNESCNYLNWTRLCVFLGQLEWVNNLQWSGQDKFLASERQTLAVNSLLQGYFRETERLTFYWMNAAGQSVVTIYFSIKTAIDESQN